MSWLNPGALWALLLVPALIVLYMLRPRSRRRLVSSLRLWQTVPQITRSQAKLRRPPLTLLLLAQAILLLLGALALLRPALTAPAGRHLVILLDASGSMLTADTGGTRFAAAQAKAHRLAAGLGADDRATLVLAGAQTLTACAACARPDLEHALDAAQPGAGGADWPAALGVAAGLARQPGAGPVETVVISDGAFDPVSETDLPPALHFIAVGRALENRAITVLSARQPPDGSPGYSAYARVQQNGPASVTLDVAALADSVPLDTRRLTLPAGGQADLVWQVPPGTARFTVSLSPGDALAADDRVVLFLPTAGQYKVRIQSPAPDIYQRALAGLPGLAAVTDTVGGAVAFTVLEGALPVQLPAGSLLLVNPSGPLLPSQGQLTDLPLPGGALNHPLLAGVDLHALLVRRAQRLAPVPWLAPVVQTAQGPLLLAGAWQGRRVAVLPFDPRDSNLPKLAAFPLLMANLAEWLDPLTAITPPAPGAPLTLPPGSTVRLPDNRTALVGTAGVFAATTTPGVYRVQDGPRAGLQFAVNLTNAAESIALPQAHPELDRPAVAPAPAATDRAHGQEVWGPLAGLVLLLLGGEWLFYCWKRGQA